ncbi:MAG: hypothetical protein IT198_14080 [Acidimicrobiia bacterium]|nr:hypothetical protein [Acidimicrobiia bacterium]
MPVARESNGPSVVGLDEVAPPRGRHRRVAVVAAAVVASAVLLAAGLLGSGWLGRDGSNGGAQMEASTPPVAGPGDRGAGTGASTADAAPALETTGEDLEAVFRSTLAYEDWLFSTGADPELIAETILPECSCYREDYESLRVLHENGWRSIGDGAGTELVAFKVMSRPAPDLARVWTVQQNTSTVRIVDADGQVLETSPPWGPVVAVYTLARGEDGRWRTQTAEILGPYEEGTPP